MSILRRFRRRDDRYSVHMAMLVGFALCGCDQHEARSGGGPEEEPLVELSVEDLGEMTDRMFQMGMELFPADGPELDKEEFERRSEAYGKENERVLALHGKVFQRELLKAIREAQGIRLTEHSNREDFVLPDLSLSDQVPAFDYRSSTLSGGQVRELHMAVESLEGKTDEGKACPFVAHHRMDFLGNNDVTSSIEICFHCGEFYWDKVNLLAPEGLIEVVEEAGLEATRDWPRLAEERARESR